MQILRDNLLKGAATAAKAINRSTLPVLENLHLLGMGDGVLTIAGTNLDTYIQANVAAYSKGDDLGPITVNARDFLAAVKGMSDVVTLDVTEVEQGGKSATYLYILSDSGSARLPTIPADEFPASPFTAEHTLAYSLAPADLTRIANEIAIAAATDQTRPTFTAVRFAHDQTRPALTAVRFAHVNEWLQLAATDGFRLHLGEVKVGFTTPRQQSYNVQSSALKLAAGIFKKDKEPLTVIVHNSTNRIQFVGMNGAVRILSQLVDGKYPDYAPIIPATYNYRFTANAPTLAEIAKKAAGIVGNKDRWNIPLRVNLTADGLALALKKAGLDYSWKVEAKEQNLTDAPGGSFAVSPAYLADALVGLDGPVVVHILSANEPFVVNPGPWLRLVMPMKFNK